MKLWNTCWLWNSGFLNGWSFTDILTFLAEGMTSPDKEKCWRAAHEYSAFCCITVNYIQQSTYILYLTTSFCMQCRRFLCFYSISHSPSFYQGLLQREEPEWYIDQQILDFQRYIGFSVYVVQYMLIWKLILHKIMQKKLLGVKLLLNSQWSLQINCKMSCPTVYVSLS